MTSNKVNKSRSTLTVQQKIEIYQKMESGVSTNELMSEYGVAGNTMRRIRRNGKSLQHYANRGNHLLTRKSRRKSLYEDLENRLYQWFLEQKSVGNSFTIAQLQRKALEMSKELGVPSTFNASRGWITRFKDRYNIRSFRKTEGEVSEDEETSGRYETAQEELIVPWNVPPLKLSQQNFGSHVLHPLENGVDLPKYGELDVPVEVRKERRTRVQKEAHCMPMQVQKGRRRHLQKEVIYIPMEEQGQVQLKQEVIYFPMEAQEEEQIQQRDEVDMLMGTEEEQEEKQADKQKKDEGQPRQKLKGKQQQKQEPERKQQERQERGNLMQEEDKQRHIGEIIMRKELNEALSIFEKYATNRTMFTVAQTLIDDILRDKT